MTELLSSHIPVLLKEVVSGLNIKPGDNVVDATVGGGGHAEEFLKANSPDGILIGIDADIEAIQKTKTKLNKYKNRVILKQGNYADLSSFLYESGINKISAVLLDLGLSRDQLQSESRGFSFKTKGKLDMRFSDSGELTAEEIINTWSEKELIYIFKEYGEERQAVRAAKTIVDARKRGPILSVPELVELAMRGVGSRGRDLIHPATRIFQALRIATNGELENLENALPKIIDCLSKGGRLAVISYHSLEDRIVKRFFKKESTECLCPKEFPVCRCGHKPKILIINKKVIVPSQEEIFYNHSSRSAKLRIVEKL